jgi:hypothetical protein
MASRKTKSTWSQVGQHINKWPRPAIVKLLKELYELSPQIRDFVQARLQAEEPNGSGLENYRRRIVEQFFPRHGEAKLQLGEARKAIRDYRKATGNLTGTIDLLLTYVESGTRFTATFGDIDEPFYDSLASTLQEMASLLLQEGPEMYSRFRDRIVRLVEHAEDIGWGYGDELRGQVHELESELHVRNAAGDSRAKR